MEFFHSLGGKGSSLSFQIRYRCCGAFFLVGNTVESFQWQEGVGRERYLHENSWLRVIDSLSRAREGENLV